MPVNFDVVDELRKRGMVHDLTPGTQEQLNKEPTAAYIGFDPTAASLHIGNLAVIMLLVHLQRAGHKPIALVGGATGMIGDPSGKSEERKLLPLETLRANQKGIETQLRRLLDFNGPAAAEVVNNYDWTAELRLLDFLRDVGKNLTVNYMMAKDSVKNRLESGISFTEFTYQLLQAYDFYWLYTHKNCKVQMGGSDQWGNITSGTELIRRMSTHENGAEAFALTCPLITKADGSKFGKSESGNVWLDAKLTSPYKFYQFWLNTADEDLPKLMRIFSLKPLAEIEDILKRGDENRAERLGQKTLAEELTQRLHGAEALAQAQAATAALFGNGGMEALRAFTAEELADVFDGLPAGDMPADKLRAGINVVDFLAEAKAYPSKGEARKNLQAGAVRINKEKVEAVDATIGEVHLLANRFVLVQKGKKNYHLVRVV
jgi:tyrosyl-tRNA synthetase